MEQKEKTKVFIEKAIKVHGENYDYSEVEYVNAHDKIIIICNSCKHKNPNNIDECTFLQSPNGHLCGRGCNKCVDRTKRRSNIEDFIEKAIKVHGNKYDYSKFIYINNRIKGIIICRNENHGVFEFEQKSQNHLQGKGCSKCSGCYQPINDEFIENARKVHDNKYDYSKFIYINNRIKGIILCKNCNLEFEQCPSGHLQGNGCNNCVDRGGTQRYDNEIFIKKAEEIHGNTYSYLKVNYINSQTKVIITCKRHGDFEQNPSSHVGGCGCPICSGVYKKTTIDFINESNKIHKNIYDYSKVDYVGCKQKVIITCLLHGDFEQTPDSHIQGVGCPFCKNKTEGKLYKKVKEIYPSLITQFKQDWCKRIFNLPFDFCIPEYKIIIELDGSQHFIQVSNWSSPEDTFQNDKFKEECANNNLYSVIRLLQEDVLYDTYDWIKELCNTIEEIKKSDEITNFYLCKNDEYNKFV
jgi:very-short-patch-repair endonuclease